MSVDLGMVRAVVRELPDAMRPAWGAKTWAGRFGSAGLRARVTEVDTTLQLSARGVTGTSNVRGQVLDRATDERGMFAHVLTLHDSGRLEAHHTRLRLDPEFRGTGFGGGFVDHARARYGAAGIDDVTMFAGMSVGGYAWARQGLELVTTEADDTARALDRGRQLADIVDSARRPIDLSSGVPHLGRRISAAEHAALEPRLVRGDELPANALTSMEELAGIPDVGRKILLGRMWKGNAEMDRTAPWWRRNGAHATRQAAEGVSWRTTPDMVATESVAAARRIASKLPAAADPFRATETFARHLGAASRAGAGGSDDALDGAQAILRVGLDDADFAVTTKLPLRSPSGRGIDVTVDWDGRRLVATEAVSPLDWRSHAVRDALDAAWRELGVDRVRSAWTGRTRALA